MTTAVSRILAAAGWTTSRYLIAGVGTEHTATHPDTGRVVVVSPGRGRVEMHACHIGTGEAEAIAQVLTGRVEEALALAHALVHAWDAEHPSEQVRTAAIGLLAGRLAGVLAELGRGADTAHDTRMPTGAALPSGVDGYQLGRPGGAR